MDRFRALEYFIVAAEEGSFSAASRRLAVTVPAVAKMVNALEKRLGTALFNRTTQGLGLTADGARYLEESRPLFEQMGDLDESMANATARAGGTLVVGGPAFVLQHCLAPALPRFHARQPQVELDLRIVNRVVEADDSSIDVFVTFGWFERPELVKVPIAETRFRVLAAPAYWAANGAPARPSDLTKHCCFSFRNPGGTLLDLWEFQRGAERESVKVTGWAITSHRDVVMDLAMGGEGVIRTTDLTTFRHVRSGLLAPVLEDWEGHAAPPVNLFFRPKHRRTPRVRAFVDFVKDTFRRLEAERQEAWRNPAPERPDWYHVRDGRASSVLRRR